MSDVLAERRGRLLADLRCSLGLTQHKMAEHMEVHPSTLASWESSARPMPRHRLDQLIMLATRKRWAFHDGGLARWLKRIEAVR